MSEDPHLLAGFMQSSAGPAALVLVRMLVRLLVAKGVVDKEAMCAAVRDEYRGEKDLADRYGGTDNVNVAELMRVVLLELGCTDIPGPL